MAFQNECENGLSKGSWEIIRIKFIENGMEDYFIHWVKGNLVFIEDEDGVFASSPRTNLKWKGWSACQANWRLVGEFLFNSMVDKEEVEEFLMDDDIESAVKIGKRLLNKDRLYNRNQKFLSLFDDWETEIYNVVKYRLLWHWFNVMPFGYYIEDDVYEKAASSLGTISAAEIAEKIDPDFKQRNDYSALMLPDGSVIECGYGKHKALGECCLELGVGLNHWIQAIENPTFAISQQVVKRSTELNIYSDLSEGINYVNENLWWLGDNLNAMRFSLLDLYASGRVVMCNGEEDSFEFFRHLNQLIGEKATSLVFLEFIRNPMNYRRGKSYYKIPTWSLYPIKGLDFMRSNQIDDQFGESFVIGENDDKWDYPNHLNQKKVSGVFGVVSAKRIGKGYNDWDIQVSPVVLNENPAIGKFEKTTFNTLYDEIVKDVIKEDFSFAKPNQSFHVEFCWADAVIKKGYTDNYYLQFKWIESSPKEKDYKFKTLSDYVQSGKSYKKGYVKCLWGEVLKINKSSEDLFDEKLLEGIKAVIVENNAVFYHIISYAAKRGIPVISEFGEIPELDDGTKVVVSSYNNQTGIKIED